MCVRWGGGGEGEDGGGRWRRRGGGHVRARGMHSLILYTGLILSSRFQTQYSLALSLLHACDSLPRIALNHVEATMEQEKVWARERAGQIE